VQVGEQAMADRYTYLPLIGPVISAVWFVSEVKLPPAIRGLSLGAVTAGAVTACILVSRHQLQYWQNSLTLFEHALEVTPDNPIAHNNLGYALADDGQPELAAVQYRVAIAINPNHSQGHYNLAGYLRERGFLPQALGHYEAVARLTPEFFMSHLVLAQVLPQVGRSKDAALQMDEALKLYPETHPETPNSPVPAWTANALNDLAWFLASNERPENRDSEHAVRFAQKACEITHYKETVMVGTLAAAYAESGRFSEAVATAEKACALATEAGNQVLLQKNHQLLELYRAGKPYHEPAPSQAGQAQ
jgi:tetratricopeptide (TPR) repeat protein